MAQIHNPPHPGEVLRDGVFDDAAVSVTDFCRAARRDARGVVACVERQSGNQRGYGIEARGGAKR